MGLFPSCTTVQIASFERLQPASINFPEQIRRVGVVNAMPVVQQANLEKGYSVNVLEGDGVRREHVLEFEAEKVSLGFQLVFGAAGEAKVYSIRVE